MASILDNILDPELLEDDRRVLVRTLFENAHNEFIKEPSPGRLRSHGTAKSLLGFYTLVEQALHDYQLREGVPLEKHIIYTAEDPDVTAVTETIAYGLIRRGPGNFGKGQPFDGSTKNLRPIQRETVEDKENPDYKQTILGYVHDNIVRFICWSRTSDTANKRAKWFEEFMSDYNWWFTLQGVKRVFYSGQGQDLNIDIGGNKWRGRPIDFYVATEDIRIFSEKRFEEIVLNLRVTS